MDLLFVKSTYISEEEEEKKRNEEMKENLT